MKKLILLFALFLLLTSCTENSSEPLVNEDADMHASLVREDIVIDNSAFALDILQKLESSGEENIFFSPLSLSLALSMTMNGAAENTLTQMKEVLHYDELSIDDLNEQCLHLISSLPEVDPQVELGIANSIWIIYEYPVKEEFIRVNEDYYLSEVFPNQPFNNQTIIDVNQWVSDNTEGNIENLLEEIDENDRVFLINALYFSANWKYQFEEENTIAEKFYFQDDQYVMVPMMSCSGLDYTYLFTDDFSAARLPYGNGHLAMYVFLPQSTTNLNELLQDLDYETFKEWFTGYEYLSSEMQDNTAFCLPSFEIDYSILLNDHLKELGMTDAFNVNADFSNMVYESAHPSISYVKQNTWITVNEAGSIAAAATIVTMWDSCFEFIVNRPFLYVIRDDRNGTILFMGIMNDPSV